MKVYLVRHGDAGETVEDDVGADNSRPLTDEGIAAVKALVAWMKQSGEEPKVVYASPLTRTMQTAKIIRDAFGLPPVRVEYGLNDDAAQSMAPVMKKIGARGDKRVVLVSHHAAIHTGLRALNEMEPHDIDPFAKGELRILDVRRKNGAWEPLDVVKPSDLGYPDRY